MPLLRSPTLTALCAAALFATGAAAAEDSEVMDVSEFRLRLGSAPGISSVKTERRHEVATTGQSEYYTRRDNAGARAGFVGAIDLVKGDIDPARGGWIYGGSIEHYQRSFHVTYDPARVELLAAGASANTSELLGMQSYGAAAFMGYAFPYSQRLRLELSGLVGMGYVQVDHDVVDVNNPTERQTRSGNGFYYQAGLRGALVVEFEEYSLGLGGEYLAGRATSKWHNYDNTGLERRYHDNTSYRWGGVGMSAFVGMKF